MNFLKSLSIYSISSVLNAGLPFFLLPVLTANLLPSEYGLLSVIQILIVLAVPLVSMNIAATVQIEYVRLDKDQMQQVVSTVLLIPVCALMILTIVFLLTESTIKTFVEMPFVWIVTIPLIAFCHVIPRLVLSLYQMSERPIGYGRFQIGLAAVNLGLSILTVAILKWGWEGRLLAILVSYGIFSILGLCLLRQWGFLARRFDFRHISDALRVGAPLIVHVISAALFMMSDRLFISYYLGNESVGVYAVGAQVAMIAMLVQQSFNQAWVPYLFRHLSTNQTSDKIKIVKMSYVALLVFMVLPFAIDLVSGPLFEIMIDSAFSDSIRFVFWVALGYSFLGMYKVVTNYIFYEKKTRILAIMTFGSLILNLILNYFFIHAFGAIGVAYATAITVAVFFVVAFVIAYIAHPMPWLSFLGRTR